MNESPIYLAAWCCNLSGEILERAEVSDRWEMASLLNIHYRRLLTGEHLNVSLSIFDCEQQTIISTDSTEMDELRACAQELREVCV